MAATIDPFRYSQGSGEIMVGTPTYKPAPEQIRPGTPTSGLTGQMIGRLIQSGVAGTENLNVADIQRLDTKLGAREVEAALQEADRIKKETDKAPDVQAIDLAELVRFVRASDMRPGDKDLAKRVELARVRLYAKIARPAGAIATAEAQSAD